MLSVPGLAPVPAQAVENVGNVMSNILRTQGRLDQTCEKLGGLKTEEAEELLGYNLGVSGLQLCPFVACVC